MPVGEPENVLPVVEGVKREIEHAKDFEAETRMHIAKVKRMPNNPMFRGGQPDRTLRVLYQTSNVAAAQKQREKESRQKKKNAGRSKLNLAAEYYDIVALGEGDPTSIIKRMENIEKQFMANP